MHSESTAVSKIEEPHEGRPKGAAPNTSQSIMLQVAGEKPQPVTLFDTHKLLSTDCEHLLLVHSESTAVSKIEEPHEGMTESV